MRKQGAHEKKRNSSDGKTRQNYIHGAAILTVGVIVMKILGFIYKIPLGNRGRRL